MPRCWLERMLISCWLAFSGFFYECSAQKRRVVGNTAKIGPAVLLRCLFVLQGCEPAFEHTRFGGQFARQVAGEMPPCREVARGNNGDDRYALTHQAQHFLCESLSFRLQSGEAVENREVGVVCVDPAHDDAGISHAAGVDLA